MAIERDSRSGCLVIAVALAVGLCVGAFVSPWIRTVIHNFVGSQAGSTKMPISPYFVNPPIVRARLPNGDEGTVRDRAGEFLGAITTEWQALGPQWGSFRFMNAGDYYWVYCNWVIESEAEANTLVVMARVVRADSDPFLGQADADDAAMAWQVWLQQQVDGGSAVPEMDH